MAGLLCLVIWIFARSFGVLVFFALLVGTISGTFWTTIAPVGAEVVGLKELPSALSIVWLVLVLPTTCEWRLRPTRRNLLIASPVAEPIALELRQKTGNVYLHAQVFTGLMYITAAVFMLFLRVWKIGDIERVAAAQGRSLADINVVVAEPDHASKAMSEPETSVLRRLFALGRV